VAQVPETKSRSVVVQEKNFCGVYFMHRHIPFEKRKKNKKCILHQSGLVLTESALLVFTFVNMVAPL